METKKELNRVEVIFALAQYCHPSWYHSILNWPTKWLAALLDYYTVKIGVDIATGKDETVIRIFKI